MGHGGQEIGFGPVGGFSFLRHDLKLFVKGIQVQEVHHQQQQQSGGHHAQQQPVYRFRAQVSDRREAQQHPAPCGNNGGMRDNAFLAL